MIEDGYLTALGGAVFAFARLEARAVEACERIEPGSVRALAGRTAGNVADKLCDLAKGLFAAPGQIELLAAARTFARLVRLRNAIVHAKPGRDEADAPILVHAGDPWTQEEFEEASGDFDRCAARFDALLDGFLADLRPDERDTRPVFDPIDRDELFGRPRRARERRPRR